MGVTSVVAWNGSASARAALLWALRRERSGLGGLLLLTVIDEALRSCGQAAMDELTVAARQALEAEATWVERMAPEVTVTARLLEGDPEQELLRHCPDGSNASAEASVVAAEEAHRGHEPLHLVHAWPEPNPGPPAPTGADTDLAHHRRSLDDPIREDFPSLDIEPHLESGQATSVLSRQAQTAALLVVGSRARGPVKRFLLGSVSRALAQTTDCPLIMVTEGDRGPQHAPARA